MLVRFLFCCTLGTSIWLASACPITHSSVISSRSPAELALQTKAQRLADAYLGKGKATIVVTMREGKGSRRSQKTVLGERGYVTGSQLKDEHYKDYSLNTRVEKMELPREVVITEAGRWVDSIHVAVVSKNSPGKVENVLATGLGLDPQRGDKIVVEQQP